MGLQSKVKEIKALLLKPEIQAKIRRELFEGRFINNSNQGNDVDFSATLTSYKFRVNTIRKEILCAEALGMSMALRKVVSSGKPWSKVPKEGTCSHTQLRLFLGIPKDIWGKIL